MNHLNFRGNAEVIFWTLDTAHPEIKQMMRG